MTTWLSYFRAQGTWEGVDPLLPVGGSGQGGQGGRGGRGFQSFVADADGVIVAATNPELDRPACRHSRRHTHDAAYG